MTSARNAITPRQLAVALIHHEIDDVRRRVGTHIAHRNADDLFNSQIRVFLERTAEMLARAAQTLQDEPDPDEDG